MKLCKLAAIVAASSAILLFNSCDETSAIGSSLTGQNVEIVIDSTFTVTAKSVLVSSVSPRISSQMLGRVDIPGFGSLSSDCVSQFLPSTVLDTATFTAENIDSISILFQYYRGDFIGDSIAPLGLTVYPLNKQLPKDLTSSFDPEGYYDKTPLATQIYNTSTFHESATDQAASTRTLRVKLPVEFGRNLFRKFVENPASYANGQVFAKDVFPGFYIANSFGNGRLTTMAVCGMTVNLRKIYLPEGQEKLDTIDAEHLYYLVTPEVINNNNIHYTMDASLKSKIESGRNIIAAPVGSELELTFPLEDILSKYRAAGGDRTIINTLTMEIPVDSIANGYGVTPPPYVLLVLKKDRDEFFAKNKLTDNVTSFYATYNETYGRYYFSSLRSYLSEMIGRETITADDYTFSLIPVQVNFENTASSSYYSTSTQVEAEIYPYIASPVMADLRVEDAKIKFTYSLQTQK